MPVVVYNVLLKFHIGDGPRLSQTTVKQLRALLDLPKTHPDLFARPQYDPEYLLLHLPDLRSPDKYKRHCYQIVLWYHVLFHPTDGDKIRHDLREAIARRRLPICITWWLIRKTKTQSWDMFTLISDHFRPDGKTIRDDAAGSA